MCVNDDIEGVTDGKVLTFGGAIMENIMAVSVERSLTSSASRFTKPGLQCPNEQLKRVKNQKVCLMPSSFAIRYQYLQ